MTDTRDAAIRQALEALKVPGSITDEDGAVHYGDVPVLWPEQVDALVPAVRQLVDAERLAVRRELTEAVERFNEDDGLGLGQLIEAIEPWLLPVTWPAPPKDRL